MKSDQLLLALTVISGLFYFSEGKPCPDNTQPHKSRCDVYFKCVILPSKTHVWIPEKCEEGLIYEPNLRMCVLPGDDWECNLEEINNNRNSDLNNDDENIVFGSESGNEEVKRSIDLPREYDSADAVVDVDEKDSESEQVMNDDDDDDGKDPDYIIVDDSESSLVSERDFESSGDGEGTDYILLDTLPPERKTNDENQDQVGTTAPTKIDPNLTAHLQRLTQLIDGLKQTYQNKDSAVADLRPDQLNAFLAHYNIKAQLNSIDPEKEEKSQKVDVVKQNQSSEVESTTSTSTQLDPETKVILTNQSPNGYNIPHPNDGYSNSQIVVNKPEGSVLFTLGNQQQDSVVDQRYTPKISEDTLKTVLQLSKQMLDSQEVRRVVPNSGYYQPQVIQPIYLSPPIPQYANSAFNQQGSYDNSNYDKMTYYGSQRKPEKSGTTIIHNNVQVSPADDRIDKVDSYGQKVHSYPPLPNYHYSSEGGSVEVQDHNYANRYENNQLVTIRPNQGYSQYSQPTTTSRPYISDSGSTLFDYYTPSPHLDESNVNNVFQMEKYPTLNIGSNTGRPPTKSHKRPDSQHKSQFYQNYNSNNYHHPNQQSILQLFPTHIDPSKVKIRPNSQKLESMEQDAGDDNDADDEEDDEDVRQSSTGDDDNQSETYNRYNANKQITANQLAQYVGQFSGSQASSQIYGNSDPSSFHLQNEDESQLGSYHQGSDLTYDLFNRKITPTLHYDSSKPDPNNCPVGIRQPNATECTRYYVCSKEDGRVMQYSCPSYTAFNPQTRICDAQYYAICHPRAVISRYTISENQRVQLEAIKALQDAKRIRDQVLRAQNIAFRLRLGENNDKHHASSTTPSPQHQQYSSDVLSNFLQNAIDSNSLMPSGSSDKDSSYSSSVSQRPNSYVTSSSSSSSSGGGGGNRKRKYYCKEGDKVADQTSIYNYFVCYKNSQGVMKGHKMTCSEGLLFCPMTSMCTLPRKCS